MLLFPKTEIVSFVYSPIELHELLCMYQCGEEITTTNLLSAVCIFPASVARPAWKIVLSGFFG